VNLPLSGNKRMLRVNAPGLVLSTDDAEQGGFPVNYQQVTPGYFNTMRIALLRGRRFAPGDDANAPRVAIVNQSMARRLFPDEEPVGRRLSLSNDPDGNSPVEIVGVVEDTRQEHLTAAGDPELYLPFAQLVSRRMEIVARGTGSGANLLPAIRNQVWAIRPDLPVHRSADMTQLMARSVSDRRFLTTVVGGFSLLALSLSAVGVYGTVAFAVSQRRREFGVRLAMGATGGSVLRIVLFRSTRMVATGIAAGVVVSFLAARVIESLLFGITSRDPLTLALAIAVVLGSGTVASAIPAIKAARVDPMKSLRSD
jgi:putative ABC transport system permease protein